MRTGAVCSSDIGAEGLRLTGGFHLSEDREAARHFRGSRGGVYVGIDVGGPRKGFHLCFLSISKNLWKLDLSGPILSHSAAECPLPSQGEHFKSLARAVSSGRLPEVARATAEDCRAVSESLWEVIGSRSPAAVFIDAPSAFARNPDGHGRATEQHKIEGVTFQKTPSIVWPKPHEALWYWILRGMMAFFAVANQGKFRQQDWESYLTEGLGAFAPGREGIHVIECFPTATVAAIRSSEAALNLVRSRLALTHHPRKNAASRSGIALWVVGGYLKFGVRAIKGAKRAFDDADSIVAALGCLPYIDDRFRRDLLAGNDKEGFVELPVTLARR